MSKIIPKNRYILIREISIEEAQEKVGYEIEYKQIDDRYFGEIIEMGPECSVLNDLKVGDIIFFGVLPTYIFVSGEKYGIILSAHIYATINKKQE